MRWIDALRLWNQDNSGKWCIPKKGTIEHTQVLEIMKGETSKQAPKKRIIKIKRTKKKQLGDGMDDTERNLRIRSMFKNTYGQDALDNYDKQQGNGMILPGRQQRGGGDFPWDAVVDFAEDPLKYINKAGKFLDSTSGTKQMAEQIERETGAKRLFKWPWE